MPALVGYLVLDVALRAADDSFGILAGKGRGVFDFLATIGVIVLLFRVGLESDLAGLIHQLRSASLIWLGEVTVSATVGYCAARYVLALELIPSVVVATAMTATSVSISARVWQETGALATPDGQRFLDVAELDDLSGVVFMGLLFAILAVLRDSQYQDLGSVVAGQVGLFAMKLAGFAGLCILFSRYLERRFTRFMRRIGSDPDPMLIVVGTGLLVAALAGILGFSVAIGALMAGVVFSPDPQSVKFDASFSPLRFSLSAWAWRSICG